jgi:hypothetical protein
MEMTLDNEQVSLQNVKDFFKRKADGMRVAVGKRELTLADAAVAYRDVNRVFERGYLDSTVQNILLAKRFTLDPKAVVEMMDTLVDNPHLIAEGQQFALKPFERMWVEYDSLTEGDNNTEAVPVKNGFLFVGDTVRVFHMYHGNPIPGAIEYRLNAGWNEEEQTEFLDKLKYSMINANEEPAPWRDVGIESLDYLYWGSMPSFDKGDPSFTSTVEELEKYDLGDSLRHHSARLVANYKRGQEVWGMDEATVSGAYWTLSRGSLKMAVAILLFLNRTREYQVLENLPTKQLVPMPNRPKVLLGHTVIRLSAESSVIRKSFEREAHSALRKLHDVRGHFCHNKVARESECGIDNHQWEESADSTAEHPRWNCKVCSGKRWRRHEHKRGFEDAGLVTSEYRVTK